MAHARLLKCVPVGQRSAGAPRGPGRFDRASRLADRGDRGRRGGRGHRPRHDRLTRNPAAFPSRRNTRAAASVVGGDGTAWLEGHAAKAFACDASITPVVTADVNPSVLDDLVRLCLELAGIVPAAAATALTISAATQAAARTAPARAGPSRPTRARPRRASLRPCRPRLCRRPRAAGRH